MTKEIKEALASGDSLIGFLVWFDCENARVTPAGLKQLFNQHGLDERHLPQDIKPKNAFQKACRSVMMKTGQTSDNRRSITKLIIDGVGKIVYGVVDLDVNDAAESIEPDFSDRVWLDKGTWSVSWDKGHPVSVAIKQVYDRLCGEYTTRDISRMIVEAMDKMAALRLRRAGVVYFVPAKFEKDLQALQNVVNNVGSCNMQLFALGDTGGSKFGNRNNLTQAAKSHVQDKIADMRHDIADLKQSIEDGVVKGQSAQNSIDVRLRRFRELKEKCVILADALRIKSEVLEGELGDVGRLIKEELMVAAA